MDFDHLAQRWQSAGDPSFRLHPAALAALQLTRADSHLSRIARRLLWESLAWGVLVLAMGSLLATQRSLLALVCQVYTLLMLAFSIREYAAARALDVAEPVALVQQRLEALRLLQIHHLKWAVLGGAILWAPFALVLWQTATGIPLPGGGLWLGANIAFGLILSAATLWLSRHHPKMNRIWRALSGESLAEAEQCLRRLQQFKG